MATLSRFLPPVTSCLRPNYTGSLGVACEFAGSLLYYIVVLTLWEYRSCQHLESPPHPGGCWATLPNINLKHCLQHWKKQASPRIASIRRSLKRPKTYPVRTIAACRRPGPYVGCAIAKYRRHSSTKTIVLVSSTITKLGGRNSSTRSAFRHPDRQNTQHFE